MVPKNERFEMRLDEETLSQVDRWRAAQADVPSRAEAMRRLIETGLSRSRSDQVRWSDGEKLLMLMLGDVYKHLKIKDPGIDPEFVAQVIYGGHYWAPKWELTGVYHDHEDSPANLRVTLDVLDMWDCLERAYERLSKKQRDQVEAEAAPYGKSVRFPGFDGNNEAEFGVIASFLTRDLERFTRFKDRDRNSHMPMIPVYMRMLGVFKPLRERLQGADLGADEVIAILQAMRR